MPDVMYFSVGRRSVGGSASAGKRVGASELMRWCFESKMKSRSDLAMRVYAHMKIYAASGEDYTTQCLNFYATKSEAGGLYGSYGGISAPQ